jgi:(R,R)-butanediol dehydrogenase / meso-butanediol dehydrogenase / diacetyl reductase
LLLSGYEKNIQGRQTMKQAVFQNARNFIVSEVPRPQAMAGGVVVKVKYCSICGSDLHLYQWDWEPKDPKGAASIRVVSEAFGGIPAHFILGHQFCGEVVEVGPGVENCKIGDRVVARGAGGYGEYAFSDHVYVLPDEITDAQAAFIEPLSVTVDAVRKSHMLLGDAVVIQGAGTIGLFVLQCVKAGGARKAIITEISPKRLEKAREFGADEVIDVRKTDVKKRVYEITDGHGPDIVFDCTGNPAANRVMLEMLPKWGKAVVMSTYTEHFEIDFNTIMLKCINVVGMLSGTPDSWVPRSDPFVIAMDLIQKGKVKIDPLISAIMPLAKINEAFEGLENGQETAVLIEP